MASPNSKAYCPLLTTSIFLQDDWTELRIGKDLIVRNMKPCTRCRMIKVDPERGVVTGQEPMETLAKLVRSFENSHSFVRIQLGFLTVPPELNHAQNK